MSEILIQASVKPSTFEKIKLIAAKEGTHRWDEVAGKLIEEAIENRETKGE